MGDVDVNIKITKSGDGAKQAVAEQQQLKLAVEETSTAMSSSLKATQAQTAFERALREEREAGLATEREMIAEEKAAAEAAAAAKIARDDAIVRGVEMQKVLAGITQRINETKAANIAAAEAQVAATAETIAAQEAQVVAAREAYLAQQALNEATAASTISTRGWGVVLSQVGRGLAGIAGLGRAFLNPIVLAVLGVIAVMKNLYDTTQDVGKIATPTFGTMVDSLGDVRQAAETAREGIEKFLGKLDAEQNRPQSAKTIGDQKIHEAQKQAADELKLLEATKEAEEKQIEEKEKTGVITHKEAVQAKLELDKWYIAEKLKIENDAAAKELQLKYTEAGNIDQQIKVNKQKLKDLEPEAAAAAADSKRKDERLKIDQDDLKKTKEQMAKDQEDIQEQQAIANDPYAGVLTKRRARNMISILEANYASESASADILEGRVIPKDEAQAAAAKNRLDTVNDTVNDIKAQLQEQSGQLREIRSKLPGDTKEAATDKSIREQIAGMQDQKAYAAAALADAREFAKIAREIAVVYNQQTKIMLEGIVALAKQHHLSAADTERLIREALNNR